MKAICQFCFLFACGVMLVVSPGAYAQQPHVNLIVINGTINPAVVEFIEDSLRTSQEEGARALVIQLDTPGGLLSSTRNIVKDILGAPVPVIVYVAPSGSGAISAGTFITMAAHVAAMAPGTNIGAAHPVGVGGQDVGEVMTEKLANFVASYGKAIAERRGRNVDWAVEAVRESRAVTEREALKLNVIDLVAGDLNDLFKQASGRKVEVAGQMTVLQLVGAAVRTLEMTLAQKFINFIADPNIAFFLIMLGIVGLYIEFSNPGMIFPGVAGAIALLLAMAAFQVLPVNYAGVALLLLGLGLLVAELFSPSFGILGTGGIISFLIGSFILFDVTGERLVIDRAILVTVVATMGGLMLIVAYLATKTQVGRPTTGREALIGKTGRVTQRIDPIGKVTVHGELWSAESDEPLEVGEEAVVTDVVDLKLRVRPARAAGQKGSATESLA